MPHVPLEDALKLVYLYAEKESPKYERAAMKFLAPPSRREGVDAQELPGVVRELEQPGLDE